MPLQTRALVFSIGQLHINTDGKCAGWLKVSYNNEYLYLFSFNFRTLHLTTPPAPASAPQPQPHGQQGSTKQGRRALCSAPSHQPHGQVSTPRGHPHNGLVAVVGCVDALADADKSTPPKTSRTRG